jgi:hypothetical protein
MQTKRRQESEKKLSVLVEVFRVLCEIIAIYRLKLSSMLRKASSPEEPKRWLAGGCFLSLVPSIDTFHDSFKAD